MVRSSNVDRNLRRTYANIIRRLGPVQCESEQILVQQRVLAYLLRYVMDKTGDNRSDYKLCLRMRGCCLLVLYTTWMCRSSIY